MLVVRSGYPVYQFAASSHRVSPKFTAPRHPANGYERCDEFLARTAAQRLVRHLELPGFMVMKKAPGQASVTTKQPAPVEALHMPVEAFLQTDDRSVLSYLVKPLRDQLARAFRER